MDSGKLDEAIGLFDTDLGLDPSAVDTILHRANLRDVPEAIRLFEKTIDVDPQFQTTDLSTAKEVITLYHKGL